MPTIPCHNARVVSSIRLLHCHCSWEADVLRSVASSLELHARDTRSEIRDASVATPPMQALNDVFEGGNDGPPSNGHELYLELQHQGVPRIDRVGLDSG